MTTSRSATARRTSTKHGAAGQVFRRWRVIKLEQNYRSSGRILKAANILIANNPHVFEKRLSLPELGYGMSQSFKRE